MEQLKDTKLLQILSVEHMMSSLGYKPLFGAGFGFEGRDKDHKRISFSTALRIHNSYWRPHGPCHARCDNVPWLIVDVHTLNKADSAKIVEKAKLQLKKKRDRDTHSKDETIICQSHLVEFIMPQYEALYLS